MTYLVPKTVKGHVYWEEVHSERKGNRVRQVFDAYIGRAGSGQKPSKDALRNLGEQELESIRKTDPEWAAAHDDDPVVSLRMGGYRWNRIAAEDKSTKRQLWIIRRWTKAIQEEAHRESIDPLDAQEAENAMILEEEKARAHHIRVEREIRNDGLMEEYKQRQEALIEARIKHWRKNVQSGVRGEAAFKLTREQTRAERQAVEDLEDPEVRKRIVREREAARKARSG